MANARRGASARGALACRWAGTRTTPCASRCSRAATSLSRARPLRSRGDVSHSSPTQSGGHQNDLEVETEFTHRRRLHGAGELQGKWEHRFRFGGPRADRLAMTRVPNHRPQTRGCGFSIMGSFRRPQGHPRAVAPFPGNGCMCNGPPPSRP